MSSKQHNAFKDLYYKTRLVLQSKDECNVKYFLVFSTEEKDHNITSIESKCQDISDLKSSIFPDYIKNLDLDVEYLPKNEDLTKTNLLLNEDAKVEIVNEPIINSKEEKIDKLINNEKDIINIEKEINSLENYNKSKVIENGKMNKIRKNFLKKYIDKNYEKFIASVLGLTFILCFLGFAIYMHFFT